MADQALALELEEMTTQLKAAKDEISFQKDRIDHLVQLLKNSQAKMSGMEKTYSDAINDMRKELDLTKNSQISPASGPHEETTAASNGEGQMRVEAPEEEQRLEKEAKIEENEESFKEKVNDEQDDELIGGRPPTEEEMGREVATDSDWPLEERPATPRDAKVKCERARKATTGTEGAKRARVEEDHARVNLDLLSPHFSRDHGEETGETESIGRQSNSIPEEENDGDDEMEEESELHEQIRVMYGVPDEKRNLGFARGQTLEEVETRPAWQRRMVRSFCCGHDKQTPLACTLYAAVERRDVVAVRDCVMTMDKADIEKRHGGYHLGTGQSPLARAIELGFADIVNELMVQPPMEYTLDRLFFEAISRGRASVVEVLVRHGCDVNKIIPHMFHFAVTPLHYAVVAGSRRVVHVLIENGADPTERNMHGETALELARRLNRAEVVEYLEHANVRSPIST